MAGRDRISNLPPDILDKIVGYLPVVEAARLAVLSSIFRDTWFNLKQLKFDYDFDAHIQMKYPEENPEFTWDTGGFNIANKVLIQHRGPIHNFLLHFLGVHSKVPIAVLFSFLDQWFLILTQKGVEEMEFQIYSAHMFKLPNCTYTCSTLKILRLSGVIVKPINTRFIFPNVTSLVFECVYFYDENLSDCGVNVPMLENLSFEKCTNMSCFNITAPRLQSLSVTDGRNNKLGSFLPVNLDFKSISTLSLNDNCLKLLEGENKYNRPH
ncbi:unnamed protein product [Cuscuta europaea]|uniref:F-box domain-containing protein n=1 Tax=Cuscuta europaea TaxID=41803 RepID=A0A9P0ZYI6_CUSEU|nr:unnamed protein product [Cuscuta europaea]